MDIWTKGQHMDNFKASGHHRGKRINLSLPSSVQLAFNLKVQFMAPPVPTTPHLDKKKKQKNTYFYSSTL